ncbi:glyoxylase-like metal-dependent hydrolase (beta-lactamase superfamily II) [Sporomusaceae bacterium BoRhaA]|uniref:MBL fold metallo-hydrolase n=1 Tax=Pelorhabdus rhamnosifermentans TaxID=2772457 RepID=UPI001C05F8A1|nr:MBL fold metallo-hydrolase [Pelorhabdus rhamnosifermentans]MBU2699992.1 glyoxylase-like metal-dependent hydrolase (beta-lactamase superfamily II) [Pelorhabdus rhamnosifermentans]
MSEITTITLGISNLFLVRDKGLLLVDTGTDATREKYVELFSKLKINPRDIDLIVISHGHSDHFAHVHELKELTDAPVLCHKNAVDALKTGKNPKVIPRNELGERVLEMILKNEPILCQTVEPDIIVESMFDLNQYGVAGKIIYTPGHSDCSITVLLDSGEAIVGDMVVSSPLTGNACAAYFANDEKALFNNIRMLLEHAHTFYSGHGGPFSRKQILKLV